MQSSILKILVVDDDPEISKLYLLLLKGSNIVCLGPFSDGKQAVRAFENDPNYADLVLIDYRMPGMDGLTASKIIKGINHKVKLIMISAFETPVPDAERGLFEQILRKPVTTKEIIGAIMNVSLKETENAPKSGSQ